MMILWGVTLSFVGKAFLALAVVFVHSKITEEKRIDGIVLMEMKRERNLALAGLVLLVIGYILEMIHFGVLDILI